MVSTSKGQFTLTYELFSRVFTDANLADLPEKNRKASPKSDKWHPERDATTEKMDDDMAFLGKVCHGWRQ